MTRTLPLMPTLSPLQFMRRGLPSSLPFPLANPHARHYYFARNGVWEAAEVLGLQPGDEVLMPSYCSGLEVEALEARGVVPVFYRLNEKLEPDLKDAEGKISSRTKVFYCIHYFGMPQPLEEIKTFCTRTRLMLFEDNALGFLSADPSGKPLGSTGDVSLFCPRKTLPLPHGGILLVNNPSIPIPAHAQQAPSAYSTAGETCSLFIRNVMRKQGMLARAAQMTKRKAIPALKGFLSRRGLTHVESGGGTFDPATARWGMSHAARKLYATFDYARIKEKRQMHYQLFTKLITPLDGKELRIVFPKLLPHTCPLEYMILVDNLETTVQLLADQGIEGGLHWWWARPRAIASQFPNLKQITDHALLLPIHQDLEEIDIRYMANILTNILKNDTITRS